MVVIQNKEDLMLAADILYYCIITLISFLAAAADGTITLNQHTLSLIILIAFFIDQRLDTCMNKNFVKISIMPKH